MSAAVTKIKTISIAELSHTLQRGGLPAILDVRTAAEFATVHAQGAHLMPLDQLNPADAAALRNEGDGRLYVLCHSGARSSTACQRLLQAGVLEVYSIEGGTQAWEKAGLPVIRSQDRRKVLPLERQVRIAAGSLVLLGAVLGWLVQPGFFALSAFVGAGLVFAGITDFCGMGIVLSKMPWNSH
ncbi:MAG: DUF2892 domain-containing protein [Acidobacteriaceae bacterium]|nr:DUF2892 domain-containing protein [Acidobacteriaceae bacterium]